MPAVIASTPRQSQITKPSAQTQPFLKYRLLHLSASRDQPENLGNDQAQQAKPDSPGEAIYDDQSLKLPPSPSEANLPL